MKIKYAYLLAVKKVSSLFIYKCEVEITVLSGYDVYEELERWRSGYENRNRETY